MLPTESRAVIRRLKDVPEIAVDGPLTAKLARSVAGGVAVITALTASLKLLSLLDSEVTRASRVERVEPLLLTTILISLLSPETITPVDQPEPMTFAVILFPPVLASK